MKCELVNENKANQNKIYLEICIIKATCLNIEWLLSVNASK